MKKLVMILALTTVAYAQQADKPMEETKKNIKVLRGVPSSQLIPIMTVMANSIGTSCLYCHEEGAWDTDAKPAKEAARRMLRMTRAMNDTHYGGKVVITCNSCHQGHVIVPETPRVTDAGWGKLPPRVMPLLPPAEDLFARYLRAWGPVETIKNRQSRGRVWGRSGRGDPRSATFDLYQELPSKVDLQTQLAYPPEANRELAAQFFNAMKIRERYATVETIAVESIRDRDAYVVRATPKDATHPELLFFDSTSGLLVRRHRESPTIVGPLPEEYDFDDYRTVDGVKMPFVMQWSRGDYQVTHEFAEVKQNVTK